MARRNGRDGIPRIGRPDKASDTPTSGIPSGSDSTDFSSADTGPVDIAAVRHDEAFIEAIRGDGPVATDNADEYQLALLLAGWREEITSPALPSGPSLDTVATAVDQEIAAAGLRRKASERRRPSLLRPVAGAAAAISLVLGGLVVFSYNSAPGDPLWSVKSVVFSEQANSTVARIDTTSKLEQAEQMLASGDVAGAQELLAGASQSTGSVMDQAQRLDLENWLQRLLDQAQTLVPAVPPPVLQTGFPLPTLPLPPGTVDTTTGIPGIPLPSVTLPPPAVTSTQVPLPPTSPPVTSVPTAPPVTQTTEPVPTILREPSPTTASASGSIDTSNPGLDTLDSGR